MTAPLDHPALRGQPSRRSLLTAGAGAGAAALLTAGAGSASAGGWTNPQAHIFAAAKTRAGAPYVSGAAGNWAFDCSGLVMWAVKNATGITINKTARDQMASLRNMRFQQVSRPAVGDLIYYWGWHGGYRYFFHVGFFAGGKSLFHAPYPGARVGYGSVDIKQSNGAWATRTYMRCTRATIDYANAVSSRYGGGRPYHC